MIWIILILLAALLVFFMMLYDLCDNQERKGLLCAACITILFVLFILGVSCI